MYNLSQNLYYGEDYYQAMTDEYNSRNTTRYFETVQHTPEQISHIILTTFLYHHGRFPMSTLEDKWSKKNIPIHS
jgi:hypothetical protein